MGTPGDTAAAREALVRKSASALHAAVSGRLPGGSLPLRAIAKVVADIMTETSGVPAAALIIRVRALRFVHGPAGSGPPPDRKGDHDEHVRTYCQCANPAPVLTAFAAAFPHVVADRAGWHLDAYTPSAMPRPKRHLRNLERDPGAEVSDGWLSNIAAARNNLADDLEWQPQYCTHAHTVTPCPGCKDGHLATRWSKWGSFFSCAACGWKTGLDTKKGRGADATTPRHRLVRRGPRGPVQPPRRPVRRLPCV
jgi:hypothetical protein